MIHDRVAAQIPSQPHSEIPSIKTWAWINVAAFVTISFVVRQEIVTEPRPRGLADSTSPETG